MDIDYTNPNRKKINKKNKLGAKPRQAVDRNG